MAAATDTCAFVGVLYKNKKAQTLMTTADYTHV